MCEEMKVTVTASAQSVKLEGYGLNLLIQKNSLPVGIQRVTLNVLSSITGHYEPPKGYQRVSPVFWFLCELMCKFEKDVTVEMQHCGNPDLTSDLKFARAVCSQKKLPYTFDLMEGGRFSCLSSYGVLSLKSFSGIAAFVKNLIWGRSYFTCLYYPLSQDRNSQQMDLVVMWNTETHLTVSYNDNNK